MKLEPAIEKISREQVVRLVADSISTAAELSEDVKLDAVAIAERVVEVFDAREHGSPNGGPNSSESLTIWTEGHLTESLTVWTVFRNPRDFPNHWVLRGFEVGGPGGPRPHADCVVGDSLAEVLSALPAGVNRLPPWPGDDPAIYESWV